MSLISSTTNLGITILGSNHPDLESASSGIGQVVNGIANTTDSRLGNVEAHTSSGAITSTYGLVILNSSSALAMTLAAPIAGLPSAGGHDGNYLNILQVGSGAHTVTTPSNAINGNKHIATFTTSAGSSVELQAYNGTWYVIGTHTLTSLT